MAAIALIMTLSATAHAQHWSVHGAGAVVGAWSDNVANNPDDPDQGDPAAESAFYTMLRPSLLFTFESPRTIHVTSAGVDIATYQTEDPPTTYNILMAHNSVFTTGPTSELGLGASVNTGRVSAVLGEAGGAVPQAVPRGGSTFVGGNLTQAYRWQMSRNWRLIQGANLAVVNTRLEGLMGGLASETRSRSVNLSTGVERTWARTSVGLTDDVGYIYIGQEDSTTQQLSNRVALTLRRDISPRWTTGAEVGLSTLTTFEALQPESEGTAFIPSGSLSVSYYRPLGTVTGALGASISRRIEPNLLLGTTTSSSGASVNGSLPLPWFFRNNTPTVRVSTTVGRTYSSTIDERLDQTPSWHVDTADVAVSWSPRDAWDVSLRYQLMSSVVAEDARMIAEANGIPVPVDFSRNTVLLQVGGRWPSRQAATLPDRRSLRVDRANEQPEESEQSPGGSGQ